MLTRPVDGRRRPGPPEGGPAAGLRRSSSLYLLVALLIVLNLVGVVMVLSASSVLSIKAYGTPWHFFERQVLWLLVGTMAFAVAVRVDRRRWRRLARPLMVVTVLLLVAVLVPGVGVRVSGATRWVGTSSLQIQPSELAKLALVLFIADLADRRRARGDRGDWWYQLGPAICVFGLLAVLILKQPDMGTTLVLGLILVAMLFTAGLPARPMIAMLGIAVVGSLVLSKVAAYRWKRMTSFLHPLAHSTGSGYQESNALGALAHGHLAGDGIGASTASWGWLPNAQTDYIFAIIGEEAGLIGTLLLAALFVGLAVVGLRVAFGARDRFSGLLAAGITAWLVGQALINIGAVVGLLPVTGVPLPFVSFGGSSLVIALFAAGVLGNIARQP